CHTSPWYQVRLACSIARSASYFALGSTSHSCCQGHCMSCSIDRVAWRLAGCFCTLLVMLCAVHAVAHEGNEVADAPLPIPAKQTFTVAGAATITVDTLAGQSLSGRVIDYDLDAFRFGRDATDAQTIRWRELSALSTVVVLGPVIAPDSAEESFR